MNYRSKRVSGKQDRLHRYVWEQANGPIPEGMIVDHINGNIHDNNLSNLRVISKRENHLNSKVYNTNTSGVTGVCWDKDIQKWRPRIGVEGKLINLGSFDDWFEAVCVRMSANNLYGYHPNHGRR